MQTAVDPRLSHAIGIVCLGAAVVFSWHAPYRANLHALEQSREHLVSLHQQIAKTQQILSQAGGEAAWTATQQQILESVKQRFVPSRALPQLFDAVLGQVAQANLELMNVSQGNLEPAKGADGKPLLLAGMPCLQLAVTLTVQGRFAGVVDCLSQLTGPTFSGVIRIDGVHLVLKSPSGATVNGTIQLLLYVLAS